MALTLDGTNGIVSSGSITTQSATGVIFSDSSSLPAASSPYVLKNRIINGDMRIDQRNAGASVTVNTAGAFYPVDRFRFSATGSAGVFTAQQVTDAPTSFTNSAKVTVTTIDSSLAATDLYYCAQAIEGFNVADLNFGTANASTVTISFWVKSSVTGAFGGVLANGSSWDRSYPFTYTISAANTWEQKTITIAGDTTGTWVKDNNIGMRIVFGLGVGSTFSGTSGAWSASQLLSSTGATNLMATLSATWQVTGVQLEVGSTATPFERRLYGQELLLCQRYYQHLTAADSTSSYFAYGTGFNAATTYGFFLIPMVCSMRANPSITYAAVNQYRVTFNTCTAIAINTASKSSLSIRADSTGLTVGQGGQFDSNNNTTSYIGISAEL